MGGPAFHHGGAALYSTNAVSPLAGRHQRQPGLRRRLSAARAALMLEEADLFGALDDADAKGHRVELVGRGDVEGTPAHHLKVTLASGLVQSWYLDVDSFLVLRKDVEPGEERDLERPRAWLFDDYRSVNGVLVPFWVFVEEPLFSREYLFETIEANAEIDDTLFEPLPGAIQRDVGPLVEGTSGGGP